MELILALMICSFVFSMVAFGFTVWNTICIQAQRQSTHTVIPISPENTTMSNIEEQLQKIATGAGANQSDLNRNLFDTGLDPEDLV